MKVTEQIDYVKRLKENVVNLIEYYMELDEVGYEKFLSMFQDELLELIKYHQAQLDKAKNLQERIGGHRSIDLSHMNFDHWNDKNGPDTIKLNDFPTILGGVGTDTIKFDLDPMKEYHSDYFWDFDRNK